MIEVRAEDGVIHMSFPTDSMTPEQINDFVTWLRVEAIARRSKLTEETAWKLSEETKADWWGKHRSQFGH